MGAKTGQIRLRHSYAHNGGNSKEFGGPIYLGDIRLQTCALAARFARVPAYLGNIANVRPTPRVTVMPATPWTTRCGHCSCRTITTCGPISLSIWDCVTNARRSRIRQGFCSSSWFCLERGRRRQDSDPGRLWNLLFADRRQFRSQLCAHRTYRRVSITPRARANRLPSGISARPCPRFRPGRWCPCAVCISGRARAPIYNQFFPTTTLIGYHNGLYNPYSEQWTFGIERRICSQLGTERGLCGLPHVANQSPARCRSADLPSFARLPGRCAPRRRPTAPVLIGFSATAN